LRGGQRLVARLERGDLAPAEAPTFDGEGSYLITGGLGGFGLAVARWLVDSGARHLVLMGRSAASTPEARDAVAALERAGAAITVIRGDVTREADVAAAIAACGPGAPLRGIVHAAMVMDDCLLPNLTSDRMTAVMGPKAAGAWHLHRLTRGLPLDFFVLFSSCSSILGLPGQANYDCANAFLDGLAWYRRSQGLPAASINWGYLGEVGYAAARSHLAARFANIGVPSISPSTAVDALGQILESTSTQVSVLNIDWATFLDQSPSCAASPRFAGFAAAGDRRGEAGIGRGGTSNLLAAVASLPQTEAAAAVELALRDQIARVTGVSPARLDVQTPLTDLGFDSLMAVELRNWVERSLGVHVRTFDIMRGPTVRQLSETLLNAVRGRSESAPQRPPAPA
jgi:NAD(P)-dependent dehydrogenase (short-subunit alcohol dehydrogenase family)